MILTNLDHLLIHKVDFEARFDDAIRNQLINFARCSLLIMRAFKYVVKHHPSIADFDVSVGDRSNKTDKMASRLDIRFNHRLEKRPDTSLLFILLLLHMVY